MPISKEKILLVAEKAFKDLHRFQHPENEHQRIMFKVAEKVIERLAVPITAIRKIDSRKYPFCANYWETLDPRPLARKIIERERKAKSLFNG